MNGYRLTETADRQLQEIWRYSRDRWGSARADAYLVEIDLALTEAVGSPSHLRVRAELGEGILACRVSSHVAYGIWADGYFVVIAVLHGRMDPNRHLFRP